VFRWCAGFRARAGPKGRRAVAKILQNKLYVTVTRLQRDCGRPCRKTRRGRSNRGICTAIPRERRGDCLPRRSPPRRRKPVAGSFGSSCACCATCTLPTVFPSLRAHEPLSCRARDPSGPGRRNASKTTCSCEPDSSGEYKRNACKSVQFTNRRIRTFIAAPSARNVNNTEDPP
jgi:hypothetical protein